MFDQNLSNELESGKNENIDQDEKNRISRRKKDLSRKLQKKSQLFYLLI